MDDGVTAITDACELKKVRRSARRITVHAALLAMLTTAVLLLLP